MLRMRSLVVVESDDHVYFIVDATRDQAELGDILSWTGSGEMTCTNETRGITYPSRVREQNLPANQVGVRLIAVLP